MPDVTAVLIRISVEVLYLYPPRVKITEGIFQDKTLWKLLYYVLPSAIGATNYPLVANAGLFPLFVARNVVVMSAN